MERDQKGVYARLQGRDKDGKFLSAECWEELERVATVKRMEVGWQRSLERLRADVEKLHGRYQKHGKRGED